MKIPIPKEGQTLYQANRGETSGMMWASWNLDLTSNAPKIRVSPRLAVPSSSDAVSTLDTPIAFVRNAAASSSVDHYFAVCNQVIMISPANSFNGVFTEDHQANSPTSNLSRLYSDACDVNGSLAVSISTDVSILEAGVWTASWWVGKLGGAALTSGIAHPLCTGFTKETLIGNGNVIMSYTSNPLSVNNARLTLDAKYEVIWIRSGSFAYWIGARNLHGGEGRVFKWDGQSQYVIGEYGVKHSITFSGVMKDEIPYTVNGNGQLLQFTGGGFSEIARFPIVDDKVNVLNDGLTTYPININRNGMDLVNGNIHILLNAGINSTTNTFLENMLSGVWEYTKETGLYHKYGISKDNSSVPSNTLDYGCPRIKQAGALFSLGTINKFLAGAQLYKADGDSTSTEIGVINWVNADAKPKMGYFISPQIYTQEIDEMWQKAYMKFRGMINSGDSITLKYRRFKNLKNTFGSASSVGMGTWTSTTGFTTTVDVSAVLIGDEIEILAGEGSGLSAKITANVAVFPGTSTLTIDTAVTGASGTFVFRVSNWTTINSATAQGYIYSATPKLEPVYKEFPIQLNSNLIQYKVLMYGSGSVAVDYADSPEVERLVSLSASQLKAQT